MSNQYIKGESVLRFYIFKVLLNVIRRKKRGRGKRERETEGKKGEGDRRGRGRGRQKGKRERKRERKLALIIYNISQLINNVKCQMTNSKK